MLLALALFLGSFSAQAKLPENANSYFCASKDKKKDPVHPVYLHQTKDGMVLGICGKKEEHDINNFSHMTLEMVSKPKKKKPVFSDKSDNKRFLAIEKKDGMLLIEKVKVDKEFVEVFRHEITCEKDKCKLEKENCIVINKVKQQWILKTVKDAKVKSRMKKLGC
jgi:hypothetical protein